MIRVLLVDDHPLFRSGLKALLKGERWLEIVGEASSGDEGVELARSLQPDVVVMDLSMPGSNGLDATRRIAALGVESRVLVLTVHAEEEYLVPVIDAGASGYLTKTSADTDLVEAIRVVDRGEVYLPARATRLLLRQYRNESPEAEGGVELLSEREREVMTLTAEGYSAREIGEQLDISAKTVDTYRGRIMEKLGLNHRSELVRFALRTGLLREH